MVRHIAVVLVAGLVWVTACEGPPGAKGDPGTDGTPCWLGMTDQNGDGVVDVDDCRGDDGQNGSNGSNGSNGQAGSDGLDCWDLNGNGAPDVATEDRNGDGVVNVNDCLGSNGSNGVNGLSNGTVNGTLTGDIGGPAEGVAVATTPDVGAFDTTDSAGQFGLVLPIGIYTIKLSSPNYAAKDIANVVVTAGGTINLTATLTANNPIKVTAPVATSPVGFGAVATLGVTVTGGTAPYSYLWSVKTAPTAVTLSSATAAAPTFTTGTLAAVMAGGKVKGVTGLSRPGFVPVSAQQLAEMSYVFNIKVTDADGFEKTGSVTIPTATLAQGNRTVPRNQIVIVSVPGNSSALDFTSKPASSAATLREASTATPWFIPDLSGNYTVAGLTVNAGDYLSAAPTCGMCHDAATTAAVAAVFKAWDNSAHGNHYFKFMEYDVSGTLVWKKDAQGEPIPAPTADPAIFWDEPGKMTTFEFGMTGAEGSHYGTNCVACHTTGYNALAVNGGFDDAAASATPPWVFPDLKAAFGGDDTTAAPNFTAWDAIPASVKKYQGMQCESCHGPLGNHSATGTVPKGEYDTAACAVCHDKPGKHDRVALWKSSLHSDLVLAEEEAIVESRGTSTSCYRCHGAQGFVEYLTTKSIDATGLTRPSSLSQTGFGDCAPGAGYRGQYEPLDPVCACKPSLTSSSSPVACPNGDSDCTGAAAGVCAQMLNSAGTAIGPFCVKATCNPKAIYCVPAAGHRVSGEDYDAACPCKPGIAVSNPFTACDDDTDCAGGQICTATPSLKGQCVWQGCAADPAYYSYLSGLGLNREEVQPISCAACHDPHTTTLRVEGDTGPLGNGAEARGAGAGALCMVCHNTRNGARGDFVSTTSIGGPHAPVETDLLLGVNAYFMGAGGNLSAHAAVANTCAGCHVELHPEEINPALTNHTFEADGSICGECHGEGVNLEALEGGFLVARGNLEKAIATAMAKALNTGTSSAPVYNYFVMAINPAAYDDEGTACATSCAFDEVCDNVNESTPRCEKKVALLNLVKAPASVVPSGRSVNLAMTFAAAIQDPFAATGVTTKVITANYLNVSSSNTLKLDGVSLATPKFTRSGIIAKANWNYWLVSSVTANPAAQVVHNPTFVFDVLNATTSKLLGAAAADL